jgi:hypothetical protein
VTQPPHATPPPPPPGGGGAPILPTSAPPRDPILVFILNLLLAGGAGSILIGQARKGIVFIVIFLAVAWPTCFAASGLVALFAAIDGYLQARTLAAGHPIGEWTFFDRHL